MNAIVDISQISFESELLGVDEIRENDAVDESVQNPLFSNDFNEAQRIFDAYTALAERGYVCRADLSAIQDLAPKYPALRRLLDDYPLGSFTQEPTSINYEVSNEGFMSTAFNAVVKALKDILNFITEGLKNLWTFLTTNRARTAAVDNLDSRLVAMQQFIVQVDNLIGSSGGFNVSEYRQVMMRAYDSEFHNLGKSWNNFRQIILDQPERVDGYLNTITSVMTTKLPPYVEAVDKFLEDLSAARTESDVGAAMIKVMTFDMTSANLFAMVREMGYDVRVRKDSRVTPFQGMANCIKNNFKSWSADRSVTLERSRYNQYLTQLTITPWTPTIDGVIQWSAGRTAAVMRKLKGFDGSSLQPGLEQVYVRELVPFIVQVTSVINGFMTLESCLGMLVQARDGTVRDVYKSVTSVGKVMDGYVVKNKSKLTVGGSAVYTRYRRGVLDAFNASKV